MCRRPDVGEQADVPFVEQTTLPEGKVMNDRASQETHIQHLPEASAISPSAIVVAAMNV